MPALAALLLFASLNGGVTNGLYPMWEQTATLHDRWKGQVGWERAQIGLPYLQLGTRPFLNIYGTWNAELKVSIWQSTRTQGALIASGFYVPTAAQSRTLGNLHASGFGNPYAPVWLVPLSFAKTWHALPRLDLHWNSTALVATSHDPANRNLSFGQAVFAELRAAPESPFAVRVHGGVEGMPVQTRGYFGLSFAYTGRFVHLAVGAAHRISFDGEASNLALFDGALLFQ